MNKYRDIKDEFLLSADDPIQKVGEEINNEVFTGGSANQFGLIGRLYLITLLKIGLTPESRVLDIGCGALRGGYWLIHFLKSNNYFGIEPNQRMLEIGKLKLLDIELLALKCPKFDNNIRFDFSVFNEKFDYIIARSIWTHSSKKQIQKMLDEFIENSTKNGMFLSSYLNAINDEQDYQGDDWVGKSHASDTAGLVYHKFTWLQAECNKRNLNIKELKFDYVNQIWLLISK